MSERQEQTVRELVDARTEAFANATKKILEVMAPAVKGIEQYIELDVVQDMGGYIEWQDVDAFEFAHDMIIILIGELIFPPGTKIETSKDQYVVVTEDTAPYFRKLIRIGLPLDVTMKSQKDVVEFLREVEDAKKKQDEVDLLDALSEHTASRDFDLSQLTEEQKKAYAASTTKIGRA